MDSAGAEDHQADSEAKVTEEQLTQFLAAVPEDGGTISNKRLRQILDWDEKTYLEVREELQVQGRIVLGRGQFGTVQRSRPEPYAEEQQEGVAPTTEVTDGERGLLEGVEKALREWMNGQPFTERLLAVTASQGRRDTGGTWTRPDLVVVGVYISPYLPSKHLEVHTFEVKAADGDWFRGVFEALAHSRAATHSYLVVHAGTEDQASGDRWDRVRGECLRLGVGLIRFSKADDLSTYTFDVQPVRQVPDAVDLHRFIAAQLGDGDRERVQTWVR